MRATAVVNLVLVVSIPLGHAFVPSIVDRRIGYGRSSYVLNARRKKSSKLQKARLRNAREHQQLKEQAALMPKPEVDESDTLNFSTEYPDIGKIPTPDPDEVNARYHQQMEKLRAKDQTSKQLKKEDLKIVHQDDHLVVLDKPTGVLTLASPDDTYPNLAQCVYDYIGGELPTPNHMVVHRLGMDDSGLIVFARTKVAERILSMQFRTRKMERQYEALVMGHMEKDEGVIALPLMRCYERPPYQRVATFDHLFAVADLYGEVKRNLVARPKKSITKYKVLSREELHGHPVTRLLMTCVSGRYHQMNIHMATFGHPVVGDSIYGVNGEALAKGGLTEEELEELAPNPNRVDEQTQIAISKATKGRSPFVHATFLKFRVPETRDFIEFRSESTPF